MRKLEVTLLWHDYPTKSQYELSFVFQVFYLNKLDIIEEFGSNMQHECPWM
jgi:hypothetical protein